MVLLRLRESSMVALTLYSTLILQQMPDLSKGQALALDLTVEQPQSILPTKS